MSANYPGFQESDTVPFFYVANGNISVPASGFGLVNETDGSAYPPITWNKNTDGTDNVSMGIKDAFYVDPVSGLTVGDKEVGIVNTLLNWDALAVGRLNVMPVNSSSDPAVSTIGVLIESDGTQIVMDKASVSTLNVNAINGAPYVPGGGGDMISSFTSIYTDTLTNYLTTGIRVVGTNGYVDVDKTNLYQIKTHIADLGQVVSEVGDYNQIVQDGQQSTITLTANGKVQVNAPSLDCSTEVVAPLVRADNFLGNGGANLQIDSISTLNASISTLGADVSVTNQATVSTLQASDLVSTLQADAGTVNATSGVYAGDLTGLNVTATATLGVPEGAQLSLSGVEGSVGQVVQKSVAGAPVWATVSKVLGGQVTLGATTPQTVSLPSLMADTSYALCITPLTSEPNHAIIPQSLATGSFQLAFNTQDEGHVVSWIAVGTWPAE